MKYFSDRKQCAIEAAGYHEEQQRQMELLYERTGKTTKTMPPVPPIVSRTFARFLGGNRTADGCNRTADGCDFTVSQLVPGKTLSKLSKDPLALQLALEALGVRLGQLHRQTFVPPPPSANLDDLASWTAINPPDPTFGNIVYDARTFEITFIDWAARSKLSVADMLASVFSSLSAGVPPPNAFNVDDPTHLAALLDAIHLINAFWYGYERTYHSDIEPNHSMAIPVHESIIYRFDYAVFYFRRARVGNASNMLLKANCAAVRAARCPVTLGEGRRLWGGDHALCTACQTM